MIIGRGRTPKLLQLSFLIFVLSIAIIGRRGSKAPICPVTRSQDPEPVTNLVSKPDVMGEYASAESVQALQAAITAMQQSRARSGRCSDSCWPEKDQQLTTPAASTGVVLRPRREFVSLAALHLTGVAQTWHLRLELEDPAISWQHFNQRCYLRFGPGLRGNALGMLTSVRQNGRPVEEYTDEFQEILGLTTTVRQDQEVDLYTAGLDEWLRIDVENLHPLNLDVAMNIDRSSSRKQRWFSHPYAADPSFFPVPFAGGSHQSAAHVPRPGQTRSPATSFVSSADSRPVAGPRPATSVTRSGSAVLSGNHPPERRLPRSEYQRRRASGLCFHCDERCTPAHNCRHLFLLVIDDAAPPSANEDFFVPDQLDQTDLERPEISLHTITGTGNGNTMRVNLLLNNRPITALIDSGSTHNFVDSATAKRSGLIIRSCPFLQVAVANAPVSPFLDSLRGDLAAFDTARTLMGKIQDGSEGPNWTLDDGLIRYKGRRGSKAPIPPAHRSVTRSQDPEPATLEVIAKRSKLLSSRSHGIPRPHHLRRRDLRLSANPSKIEAVRSWHKLQIVKST
nr:uncharacterized protein LOC109178468 [Ipomoea batatas]